MPAQKVLFVTLKTFSLTGGVEKVCRGIAYALQEMLKEGKISFQMISLYDGNPDERYAQKENFKGYGGKRLQGVLHAIKAGLSSDTLILSHINLAPIGLAVKLLSPKTKVILWVHGIEVWRPINTIKKWFLRKLDKVVAVSQFTASEVQSLHRVEERRIKVIPNALDPFFHTPEIAGKPEHLRSRYQLEKGVPVCIALTRLSITEKNKNYDKVIEALGKLKKEGCKSYYILAGKYDQAEYNRIQQVAVSTEMMDYVILPGFIPDEELADHYQLADAFVLPSTKEGFGIAFVEAMACGLPVIAGNKDGSSQALLNGELGTLINPGNKEEITEAILKQLLKPVGIEFRKEKQKKCLSRFHYSEYAKKIKELIIADSLPSGH